MLSDQNEMVFDLRGKLSEAEKEIADLRSAHHDMESFLELSKEEAHDMLDKLTRKTEKEKQHRATIEGLEVSNSRLRQELQLYKDDDSTCSSSSSSSSSSSKSSKSNSDSSHSSISGDDSCIVMGSRGERDERGDGRSEAGDKEFGHGNSQHRHTHKHRGRDGDRDRGGAPASKLTPHDVLTRRKVPRKGITPGLGPTSSEGGLEMQVRGQDIMELDLTILKKQLRATSRRELKDWVVSLTKGLIETQQKIPSDSEVEENEKAKKLFSTQVQVLEAELLSCSQAAKEFKKGREEAESLLMRKEKEGLRAAQSMVGTSPPYSPLSSSLLLSLLFFILISSFLSSLFSYALFFPLLSSPLPSPFILCSPPLSPCLASPRFAKVFIEPVYCKVSPYLCLLFSPYLVHCLPCLQCCAFICATIKFPSPENFMTHSICMIRAITIRIVTMLSPRCVFPLITVTFSICLSI
jgi:hypothetical protein